MKSVKRIVLALGAVSLIATSAWAGGGSDDATAPKADSVVGVNYTVETQPSDLSFDSSATYGGAPARRMAPTNPPGSGDGYDVWQNHCTGNSSGCGGNNGCGSGCGTSCCGGCGGCGCGCGCGIYGYVGGLIMTRNAPDKFWTTYDQANNNNQILNTEDARINWNGGAEVTLGMCCGCDWAIEGTYWGIWNMNGSASVTDPNNNLGTPMDTTNGNVTIGGQTADSFFTNAHEALIQRNDSVNNVEVNFVYSPNQADNCCCFHWNWLAGVRYLKFDEDLDWTSVAGGFTLGSNGGVNQATLGVNCHNDMVGFQVGNGFTWRFANNWSLIGLGKVGVYGNQIQTESRLYRGDGVTGFDLSGQKDTVSFLGEADLGLAYDINCHWQATLGYRVVAATGVGLSDNQIPHFLAAADEFTDVKTNGELVLHGAYAGLLFRF